MSPGRDSAEPSGAERPKAAAVTRHMSSRVAGASGDASAGSQPFSSAWESWTPAQCAPVRAGGGGRHAGGHGHGLRHGDAPARGGTSRPQSPLSRRRRPSPSPAHSTTRPRPRPGKARGHTAQRRAGRGRELRPGQRQVFSFRCAPSWRGRCRAWRPRSEAAARLS